MIQLIDALTDATHGQKWFIDVYIPTNVKVLAKDAGNALVILLYRNLGPHLII